jgi:hypothetical protein
MKARQLYILLAMALTTSLATAQSAESEKGGVAILGGVNFQNFNGKDFNGDKLENDLIAGFHAGLNVQIPIAPEFYFQPGLLFSTKGAKNVTGQVTSTYRLSYLELPLNLVYKSQVGNGYIMLGFGPYVGYAVSGKATYVSGSVEINNDIEFTNEVNSGDPLLTPYFKAMDIGGNLFFGYEMAGGLFIQLNSQLGMVKINPDDNRIADNKTNIKNTGFGLSAGYRF